MMTKKKRIYSHRKVLYAILLPLLRCFLMMQRYSLQKGSGLTLHHNVTQTEMQWNPTQCSCSLLGANNQPGAGTGQDYIRFPHCP